MWSILLLVQKKKRNVLVVMVTLVSLLVTIKLKMELRTIGSTMVLPLNSQMEQDCNKFIWCLFYILVWIWSNDALILQLLLFSFPNILLHCKMQNEVLE